MDKIIRKSQDFDEAVKNVQADINGFTVANIEAIFCQVLERAKLSSIYNKEE